jgi:UDP-GlcNAc:undecaprenyl-phosphate GlcNAc-1-phosphate transferase
VTLYFVLVFAIPLVASFVLTPLTIRLARRYDLLDQPAGRHAHLAPTPRLGGVPLTLALLAALAVTIPFPRTDPAEGARVLGLAAGIVLVAVVGLFDDLRELKPLPLFVMQAAAAALAIASGIVVRSIANPFGGGELQFPEVVAVAFTFFWIVGLMNTINFLDGLDGLCAGSTLIASCILFIHTFRLEQYSVALLPLGLAGATLGLLVFNFPPARIFLGSGAYVLGFAVAVLSIIGGTKGATLLLVFAIPILDVAWQILNRVRQGRSPFAPDRGHLHHRLVDSGLSTRAIVLLYYGLTGAFGALALALPGPYKAIALVLIGAAALAVLVRLRK